MRTQRRGAFASFVFSNRHVFHNHRDAAVDRVRINRRN